MAAKFGPFNFVEKSLFVPDIELAADALQKTLLEHFSEAKVDVVDCPDLSKEPFYLSSEGIGGSPSLISFGTLQNFVPELKLDKLLDIRDVPALAGLKSASFIGTSMYECHRTGYLPETLINTSVCDGELTNNRTVGLRIDKQTGKHVMEFAPTELSKFPCLVDALCSKGEKSKVLRVRCSKRTAELPFPSVLRKGLTTYFQDKPIGLGGVFLVKQGKATCHVNHVSAKDRFKKTTYEEFFVESCNFIDMSAPLVAVGVINSHEPDLDLRPFHFHSYSEHGDGGHFHHDTTPELVEYLGYFSLAETVYRIDYPEKSPQSQT